MAIMIDYSAVVEEVWKNVKERDPMSLSEWLCSLHRECPDVDRDNALLQSCEEKHEQEAKSWLLDSIRNATSGDGGGQRSPQENLLLKLIRPVGEDVPRVRLALQFLHAMVKRSDCEKYVRATINFDDDHQQCSSPTTTHSKRVRLDGILHEAARYGCCQILEKFIDQHNVNKDNALGETALHIAAEFGHDADVDILLKHGARILCDKDGCTPLHSAAISSEPNTTIARSLVAAILREDPCLLNQASNDDCRNTALHMAAGNPKITASFIAELHDMDPRIRNGDKLTPLHIAATSQNSDAIVMMLHTFAPTTNGWDVDDVDISEKDKRKEKLKEMRDKESETNEKKRETLISMCARSGNARAVGMLIEHGADISKDVLQAIADESVRYPEKTEKLLEVYRTIADGAVTWRCLEETKKCPIKGSEQYRKMLKEAMLYLNTFDSDNDEFDKSRNFIEWCIDNGAEAFLREIFNTRDVFRFDENHHWGPKHTMYDVTHIVHITKRTKRATKRQRTSVREFGNRFPPEESYLNRILNHAEEWKNTTILKAEPFRKLTQPLLGFVQRLYFVVGLIQLVFMSFFTMNYISPNASLPRCSNPPTYFWLVWPIMLFVSNLAHYCWMCFRTCWASTVERCVDIIDKKRPIHDREKLMTRLLLVTMLKLPVIAFSLGLFVWFNMLRTTCPRVDIADYQQYLEVTAVTLLFGWMVAFIFFSGVSKSAYVFSLVLREIIVKDILSGFSLIFVFSVIAFSSAIHVLRQAIVDAPEPFENFNDIFAAALSIGDFFSKIDSEKVVRGCRISLLRAIFIIFITFMVVVLLNVLIAMVSNRYEEAKIRAESIWRFETVQLAMMIHNKEFLRRLLRLDRCFFCCLCCCLCCGCGNETKKGFKSDHDGLFLKIRKKQKE